MRRPQSSLNLSGNLRHKRVLGLFSTLLCISCGKRLGIFQPTSNLTVCIPSTIVDYDSGDLARVLSSIRAQRVLPLEVIVTMSEVPKARETEIRDSLARRDLRTPLQLEFTEYRRSPGQNRNHAVKYAKGDVISFFDADDIMHPERTHVLSKEFDSDTNLRLVLHGLINPQANWGKLRIQQLRRMNSSQVCTIEHDTRQRGQLWLSSHELKYELTHGHLTVHRSLAEQFQFENGTVGEDCLYVRSILRLLCSDPSKGKSLILDFPFTKYTPRAQVHRVQAY